jgi:cytosine/adenosine deaminase-related metal-dependent hydrolase
MASLYLADGRQPQQGRSARTHLGGRAGMSAVWHHHGPGHVGLSPFTDEQTDVVIAAYREAGIRVVFSPMVLDIPPIAMVRHKDGLPPVVQEMLGNKPRAIREQLGYLEHQFKRHPASGTLHWAIAPFPPQRCTPKMLQGCAELADKYDLARATCTRRVVRSSLRVNYSRIIKVR